MAESDPTGTAESTEVAVLVPAAGRGRRLGGQRKQFRMLGGRPLLVQVLLVFERHAAVDHIVVAAPSDHVEEVTNRLQAEGLSKVAAIVSGGDSRQASVRYALRAVPAPVDVVLVHDAVRPFVGTEEVTRVVERVRTHGAAALAVPVADTLRKEEGDRFGDTVSRDDLYRMQTPQGFRRAWLEDAHRVAAEGPEAPATDDVGLVQRIGHEVHVVSGSRRNFKITTQRDWTFAQQLWEVWSNESDRVQSTR